MFPESQFGKVGDDNIAALKDLAAMFQWILLPK